MSQNNISTNRSHQKNRQRHVKGPRRTNGGNNGWNQGGKPYFHQQGGKGVHETGIMGKTGGNTGGYGGQGTGGTAPAWQKQQKPKGTPGGSHSNTRKSSKKSYTAILAATMSTTTDGNATQPIGI